MRRGKTAYYFCMFALVMALVMHALPVARAGVLDEKFAELEQMQKQIEETRKQIEAKRRSENSVLKELEQIELELELAQRELDYLMARMQYLSDRIAETEAEIAEVEKKTEQKKDLFCDRLVCMYKAGRISYLEVLLDSKSVSEFMARLYYLREIAQDDARLIEEFKVLRQELAEKKALLEQDVQALTVAKAEQEQRRAAVASRSADRERYLAQLQQDRQKLEEVLDQCERQSRALEQVIKELQAQGHQREKKEGLSMIRPVDSGWVSSEYGNRWHPLLQDYRWHGGIDIAVNSGTPIKAAEDGTVIVSTSDSGYGYYVVIDHGGGISTLYAHCSKLLVSVGDVVTRGQTVALAGSTGVSTGPHLHFEVRVNGATDDPRKWVNF
ncbi:MAG TPA: peptidoglycan DD-metalloendopeptidase family protein [Firmicutes bacterium]|jgi:murein DD-endopeptidase MepM/ murein hydrolase activator NlpD|nr:peptidoglycan DD-metalloendopeptidase family protein [Bacillota bacterium]